MQKLAPIVLFVYNRPWHTQQTIEALRKNKLAIDSELFIYSDAPKNEGTIEKVQQVRDYIKSIDGFKKITIIEREKNWGLADSIIDGVTKIVNQYGKIIVLEDDIVTGTYFLKFMNDALEFYQNEEKVWHISGWNYPINTESLDDAFLWRVMNCWGWATWANRWQYYEKNVDKTIGEFTQEDIKRFNLDKSENFWEQIILNKEGKINTWAIFWYATIFKNSGLCLNPAKTFVENIGHDSTGEHCGSSDSYKSNELSFKKNVEFTKDIKESMIAVQGVKEFFSLLKKPFYYRVINKLSRTLIQRNLLK
ncbi:glycosyltransferase [Francisella philomiragia]|uniref:Glycosyl transferase 2 family protein n=1 Tax=Francisella philomiragia TaxID=28110 RepID=A0A0B6CZE3_9GAMM|nr:glycosyltransferase [Francisella philomiragia]AJI54235.1 glycosyl transferase 2 family protein [Francisella philomiragia]